MILFSILVLFIFKETSGVIYRLNEDDFNRMPPIYRIDPYTRCLDEPGGMYCTVELSLVSDEKSELLTMIQDYSAHTEKHFNHTSLRYYICVTDTCKDFYTGEIDPSLSIEGCFNDTLWNKYRLKTRVEHVMCDRQGDRKQINEGDLLVASIVTIIIILNIIGTIYGILYMYKKIPENKLLLSFSILENWKQLRGPAVYKTNFTAQLRGLNGGRSITMLVVILAHSIVPSVLTVENVQHFERMYDNIWYHIFFDGALVIQVFFVISGLLLVYNALGYSENHKITWICLPKWIMLRWLRIIPSYALIVGITATWIRFAGSGPLWKRLVESEVNDCHRDWWHHILLINNYFDNSQCLPQTWYLAADMQLHVMGIMAFVLVQSDKGRKLAMYTMLLIGLIIPPMHTYFQNLNGSLIVSPEVMSMLFMSDPTFNNVYKRGHTNIAGFAMGMITGYIVYNWQKTGIDTNKFKKYRFLYWTSIPSLIGIILLGAMFYQDAPPPSLLVRTAYAAVIKPLFGVIVALIIVGMVFKIEGIYRGILEWSRWTLVGRLSYCAYLLHVLPIRVLGGIKTELTHVSFIQMTQEFLWIQCITFIAAIPFWLMVERPITHVITLLASPDKQKDGDKPPLKKKKENSSEVNKKSSSMSSNDTLK